jgi:Amt family ammonium transporter
MGAGIAWVLGIVGTLVILKIVDSVVGIRCEPQEELEGLDLSMHGEEGYNLDS